MQKMKNSLERDAKNEEFVQGSNKEDIKVKFVKSAGILEYLVYLYTSSCSPETTELQISRVLRIIQR